MTRVMLTFKLEAANVNFQQFWTFLTIFKILCCLTVLVVSEQVLNDLERFCTTLIKKEFFSERRICFGNWSHCLTVLVVCERALNNWKRFDTNLVNKLFVTTIYLVFGHEKQFLTVFSVIH